VNNLLRFFESLPILLLKLGTRPCIPLRRDPEEFDPTDMALGLYALLSRPAVADDSDSVASAVVKDTDPATASEVVGSSDAGRGAEVDGENVFKELKLDGDGTNGTRGHLK
jgi:hypothetical protein